MSLVKLGVLCVCGYLLGGENNAVSASVEVKVKVEVELGNEILQQKPDDDGELQVRSLRAVIRPLLKISSVH